ncbi:MAG TPA: YjfB family protein [Ruminiclostridium sp.]|nr:YjfB family protein [Ruminiclostridium sp.]
MDIAALSMAESQAQVGEQVGIAVTKLAMNSAKEDSNALSKMMELSVNPNIGRNFDQSV